MMKRNQAAQLIRLVIMIAGSVTGWVYLDEYAAAIAPVVYAGSQSIRKSKIIHIKKQLKKKNPDWTDKQLTEAAIKQLPKWITLLPL